MVGAASIGMEQRLYRNSTWASAPAQTLSSPLGASLTPAVHMTFPLGHYLVTLSVQTTVCTHTGYPPCTWHLIGARLWATK